MLVEEGLTAGDHVGLLGASSIEWDIAQFGVLACGGVVVGLDLYDTPDHMAEIADKAGLTGLILATHALEDRLSPSVRNRCRFVMAMEHFDRLESKDEEQRGRRSNQKGVNSPQVFVNKASPTGPAVLIFTSGTTGTPKGIVYTHQQVCLAVEAILAAFDDIQQGDKLVCWLPLANLFQRIVNFCAIMRGAITYYVQDPRNVVAAVTSINPHVFIGVPRFYEKLYRGIMEYIAGGGPLRQRLIQWALSVGEAHARLGREGASPPLVLRGGRAMADVLVLRHLRATMGSNLRYMVSGSAPMPKWLLERFHAMGLLILEAYGLSENIVPMATNRPRSFRFGTVGQPLVSNDIRIGEDGQLLVRGPGVFSGYYGEQGENEAFSTEGYFETGDFGSVDRDGFITLQGRAGDIIKTSTGRRVAAVAIEESIRSVTYIEHAVMIGAKRKSLIAILSVSIPAVERLHGAMRAAGNKQDLGLLASVIGADVSHSVERLPPYQRPAGLLVTVRPFTLEGGELTSNQKLRRSAIAQKYARAIDRLYADLDTFGVSAAAGGRPLVVVLPA